MTGVGDSLDRSIFAPGGSVSLSVLWVWFDSAWLLDGVYHPGDAEGEDLETAVAQCEAIGRPHRVVRFPAVAPDAPSGGVA